MQVKICGVVDPEEAAEIARLGADYIGVIFARRSKRLVSGLQAQEIALAAKQYGVETVAVFADESFEEVLAIREQTGIGIVQLHGSVRELTREVSGYFKKVIYAVPVRGDGTLEHPLPLPEGILPLYDAVKGGMGVPFDWETFNRPKVGPWMLAGGLHPGNVSKAIERLKPSGVDVASGVEREGSVRKDMGLVEAFINEAKKRLL